VKVINKYLQQYAEPEARSSVTGSGTYPHCIVIPAYREPIAQLERVWRDIPESLIIVVVNSPTASDPETLTLLNDMEKNWQPQNSEQNCHWYQSGQHKVLVIDRCHTPLDSGVGEARKIGNDIAVRLLSEKKLESNWVHHTDADARLPADYFLATDHAPEKVSVMLYCFDHSDVSVAAALYEFSLLWYAFGLRWAGSSYGHTSIGSTIACRAEAYAQVRGWPKRQAGEDFYLLNKLHKVGTFAYADSEPISLSSRPSDRVPFGTGPGIRKIAALKQPLDDYLFYHPMCFVALQNFLNKLHAVYDVTDIEQYFTDDLQREYVLDSGLAAQIRSKQDQSEQVFSKFLDDWFDGFRSLKFIHFVRDRRHKSVGFRDLWQTQLLPTACPLKGADASASRDIKSATQQLWRELLG
jgi:hypothetical protein